MSSSNKAIYHVRSLLLPKPQQVVDWLRSSAGGGTQRKILSLTPKGSESSMEMTKPETLTLPSWLEKGRAHRISTHQYPKHDQQKIGPFKILEVISDGRAYKLNLPASMKRIHPVISITHLEPAADQSQELFS